MHKERFPTQRKSKLQPRGDGPFQALERIKDNAYKIDFPSDYGNVRANFNVTDLSLFSVGDSRTIFFEVGEYIKIKVLINLMFSNILKIL